MALRLSQFIVIACIFAAVTSIGYAYGPRPGPSMTIGQNWYYNPYGQGNYGRGQGNGNGQGYYGGGRGYYGGNWPTNNINSNNQQVNGPGFSDGYGVNVDEYAAYGAGPYGYGANQNNYNGYGNTGSFGEGAAPSYSPYGFGGYSRFTNGW